MNSTINFLIVEDSLSYSIELRMMLEEIGYNVIGEATNSAMALEIIFSRKPDIILMDIEIDGEMSGTEIARHIKHLNIPIIFITSFDNKEKFTDAKLSNMHGYLIKPVSRFTLESTIETTFKIFNDSLFSKHVYTDAGEDYFNENIFIKKNDEHLRIKISDIQFVEAEGTNTYIYIDKNRHLSRFSLTEIRKLIPTTKFISSHRSFLLNLEYIHSILKDFSEVKMENGYKVKVSRINRNALRSRINSRS